MYNYMEFMLNKKKSINSFHTKYTEYTMCYATTAPINHTTIDIMPTKGSL